VTKKPGPKSKPKPKPKADAEQLAKTAEQPVQPPEWTRDAEATVNLTSDDLHALPGRDDLEAATMTELPEGADLHLPKHPAIDTRRAHLKGLVEALIFASDKPLGASPLAKAATASIGDVRIALAELKREYATRGVQLDEVAGGWIFRTNAAYAPFVRELTKQKPVRLTRAQIETLAILAYRQPITRPEVDEIRGVDSGPVLKLLLERELVKILGKRDEPGRPLLYGTTPSFLEFFGLKSLKDLPTLKEFTDLNEDSRRVVERELGESLETAQSHAIEQGRVQDAPDDGEPIVRDTISPGPPESDGELESTVNEGDE
jgi:segregation and condensation protein B